MGCLVRRLFRWLNGQLPSLYHLPSTFETASTKSRRRGIGFNAFSKAKSPTPATSNCPESIRFRSGSLGRPSSQFSWISRSPSTWYKRLRGRRTLSYLTSCSICQWPFMGCFYVTISESCTRGKPGHLPTPIYHHIVPGSDIDMTLVN